LCPIFSGPVNRHITVKNLYLIDYKRDFGDNIATGL